MTEQEAIRILEHLEDHVFVKAGNSVKLTTTGNTACNMAISSLKEVQRYKQIGTVDECQSAIKKIKLQKKCKDCMLFVDRAKGARGALNGVCKIRLLRRYGTHPACKFFKEVNN